MLTFYYYSELTKDKFVFPQYALFKSYLVAKRSSKMTLVFCNTVLHEGSLWQSMIDYWKWLVLRVCCHMTWLSLTRVRFVLLRSAPEGMGLEGLHLSLSDSCSDATGPYCRLLEDCKKTICLMSRMCSPLTQRDPSEIECRSPTHYRQTWCLRINPPSHRTPRRHSLLITLPALIRPSNAW